jgi:hypothetical protein
MNVMQLYARQRAAAGMGTLGDAIDEWGDIFGAPRTTTSSSAPWWQQIIAPVTSFGHQFLQQWGNREAYRHQVNPNAPPASYQTGIPAGMTPEAYAQLLAAQAAAARGGGDGLGIRFADGHLWLGENTKISYTTLMIAGFGLYLIQSPGFQRKGR